jgi:peptide/nickel transport system permease protein
MYRRLVFLIARQLAQALLVIVAASILVFTATEATPGSVARKILGQFANQEQVALLASAMKLNEPAPVRYVRWAGTLLGITHEPLGEETAKKLGLADTRGGRYLGNFGFSQMFRQPVNDVLWGRLANSALLAGISLVIIVVLAVGCGVVSGLYPGGVVDRVVSLISVVATSLPQFVWAVFLITIFTMKLAWLPGTAPLQESEHWSIAQQLVLPVLTLVLVDFGYLAAMIRSTMIETMSSAYIRAATLKGLTRGQVIFRHALRNAMIAPFTIILLQINYLITGVVVTEAVFSYPGFGLMLLNAALFGDIALIQGATMVAVLIAIATQLIGDVGYMLLDPRIRVATGR